MPTSVFTTITLPGRIGSMNGTRPGMMMSSTSAPISP